MTALAEYCVCVHGVSVILEDQLILLSATSGTGKTTLSNLLRDYCGAAVVNGDYAFLSYKDGHIYFEPSPFCGSSGICHNYRLTLDRIVFLGQADENIWRDLNPISGYAHLLGNCFLPEFDREKRRQIKDNALRIIERIPASDFVFQPTAEAARLFSKEALFLSSAKQTVRALINEELLNNGTGETGIRDGHFR